MKARTSILSAVSAATVLLGACGTLQAQWLSQTNTLKPGWNAVFLHVDASHITLTNLIAADINNPILEVWLWAPTASTMQFVDNPLNPLDSGSQWASWIRASSGSSVLQRLIGNAAYLVRVGTNVTSYNWVVKGRPVPPRYQWTTTGLNFLGFPAVTFTPPNFETFLSQCPALYPNPNTEIYQYVGGDMGTTNPVRVLALRNTSVKRGQAYWIRAGSYFNRYFAPFEAAFTSVNGVNFDTNMSVASFRLRNLTATNLTVTLRLLASEPAPAGQSNLAGAPALLLRGSINLTDLTYGYTNLAVGGSKTWTLTPQGQSGSEVEVVLGLNRAALTNSAGAQLAGILRLTDSLGFSQVDAPVTATVGSTAGLWVGNASITQVGEYLKSYQRDDSGNLIVQSDGTYSVVAMNTNLTSVPRPFPLRLIVHNPEATGNAVLLQRVYVGLDANTNPVVARQESALNPGCRDRARRISAAHLPWSNTNAPWSFNGRLGQLTNLAATVTLDYNDQASNPFVHTYHPDHDNLDATFANVLPQGAESYSISRGIALMITPPPDDFAGLTGGGEIVSGNYAETISMSGLARAGGTNDMRRFQVLGVFSLNRVSKVPTLTVP